MAGEQKRRIPRRGLLIILLVVVLLAVVAIASYLMFYKQPVPMSLNDELLATNHEFSAAYTYMKERDYASAKAAYERALSLAKNSQEAGLIRFNEARATEYSWDFTSAIKELKDIAANATYTGRIRAYAVQEIGMMRTTYPWEATIPDETFSGDPYTSFKQGVDENQAYERLFTYAVSLSPLSLSYMYEAYWETDQVVALGATTTPEAQALLGRVHDALSGSLIDKSRFMANLYERVTYGPRLPDAEARLTERLAALGADGFTNAHADELYATAVQMGSVGFKPGNLFVYHYALFLARTYGDARQDSIRQLVSIFTPQNKSNIVPDIPKLIGMAQHESAPGGDKQALRTIAQIAPTFKEYLQSLGWNESDFASH